MFSRHSSLHFPLSSWWLTSASRDQSSQVQHMAVRGAGVLWVILPDADPLGSWFSANGCSSLCPQLHGAPAPNTPQGQLAPRSPRPPFPPLPHWALGPLLDSLPRECSFWRPHPLLSPSLVGVEAGVGLRSRGGQPSLWGGTRTSNSGQWAPRQGSAGHAPAAPGLPTRTADLTADSASQLLSGRGPSGGRGAGLDSRSRGHSDRDHLSGTQGDPPRSHSPFTKDSPGNP